VKALFILLVYVGLAILGGGRGGQFLVGEVIWKIIVLKVYLFYRVWKKIIKLKSRETRKERHAAALLQVHN